jgi:hypothetical protein
MSSATMLPANAAAIDDRVNRTKPMLNTRRRPILSAIEPAISTTDARASV